MMFEPRMGRGFSLVSFVLIDISVMMTTATVFFFLFIFSLFVCLKFYFIFKLYIIVQLESEMERNPEVPASTREEALFH